MNGVLGRLDLQLMTRAIAFVPRVLAAMVVTGAFWFGFRATRGAIKRGLERAGVHQTLVAMLVDRVYRLVVVIFGLVMAADQLGINVGAALAGLGVAGIAIGFAAQDSLANVIAGFLIFVDKPFEIGDWVTVADNYGVVKDITMRSTRIRTNRNTYVVIPNKTIIDTVLVNHSKHGETRVDIVIGIAYKESVTRAREVVLEAVRSVEGIILTPAPDLVVTELAASSVNMNVRVWIDDAAQEKPVHFRVMEASKLALDAAGIEIPYHHLQLFLENVDERVWRQAAALAELLQPAEAARGRE